MVSTYLQRIGTAVPEHDIHEEFVQFAEAMLSDPRAKAIFRRLAIKSGIQHRFSCLSDRPCSKFEALDAFTFYCGGNFPTTGRRMQIFEQCAPLLVRKALDKLSLTGEERSRIRHVLVTCCTGLYAPGLDFEIIDYLGLPDSTERTMVGFMGCYAAINALRLARHIVRSKPNDCVLIVSIELCSLHFQETQEINEVLSFLLFADGCAAALVGSSPGVLVMDDFRSLQIEESRGLITWRVGDMGFDMSLSTHVPNEIARAMRQNAHRVTDGKPVDLWAVHPGGRSILDAVESGLGLDSEALESSRRVLRNFGNMSSATVMFVLEDLIRSASRGQNGCAMSFGPGLTAEIMHFHAA